MQATSRILTLLGLLVLAGGAVLLVAGQPVAGIAIGCLGLALAAWATSRDSPLGAVALVAAVAVVVAAYLTERHVAAGASTLCTVDAVFDCDLVNRSRWSEVAGLPTALWAAAFYGGVLGVAVAALLAREAFAGAGRFLQVAGLVAVATSAFMAAQSARLGAWCLFCIALYVSSVLLLLVGTRAARARPCPLGDVLAGRSDRSLGTALLVGTLLLVPGALALPPAGATVATGAADELGRLYMEPAGALSLRGDEPVLGDPGAPITLVEFADFGCPHCAEATPRIKAFVRRHPEVRLLYKHYPLSADCNPNVSPNRITRSCEAARAAECAHRQGRFWELSHLMFANQGHLEPDDIRFMADQAGLDVDALFRCMEDPAVEATIRQDVESAARAGVMGTPTLFAKGLHPDGWLLLDRADATALELLLRHRGELPPPRPYEPPF